MTVYNYIDALDIPSQHNEEGTIFYHVFYGYVQDSLIPAVTVLMRYPGSDGPHYHLPAHLYLSHSPGTNHRTVVAKRAIELQKHNPEAYGRGDLEFTGRTDYEIVQAAIAHLLRVNDSKYV